MWAWKKITRSRRSKRKKSSSSSCCCSSPSPSAPCCHSPANIENSSSPCCHCSTTRHPDPCSIHHFHHSCQSFCAHNHPTPPPCCIHHSPALDSHNLYPPHAPPLPEPDDHQPLLNDPLHKSSHPPAEEKLLKHGCLDSVEASCGGIGPDPGYGSFQSVRRFGCGQFEAGSSASYQQYIMAPQTAPAFGLPVSQDLPSLWSTGLCDCFADVSICLLGSFCPCVLFGKNAEELDHGMTSCATAAIVWYLLQQFTTCGWIYTWGYRKKLRSRYGLPERPLPDCIVHFLCWYCALCQEHRELKTRGSREETPWINGAVMVPPLQQTMRLHV